MYRDLAFACPALLMVQSNIKFSTKATSNYLFALNQTIFSLVFLEENTTYYGVSHFSDIPYVFNQATARYASISSHSDITISSDMSGSWASFAAHGDPSRRNGTILIWVGATVLRRLHANLKTRITCKSLEAPTRV